MKSEMDWEAGEAMQDKEKMFLLYVVSEGLCSRISDFQKHFEGVEAPQVQALVEAGFLAESDGCLEVTERGQFVLGSLAERDDLCPRCGHESGPYPLCQVCRNM